MKKLIPFLFLLFIACDSKRSWTCVEGNCENGHGKKVWLKGGSEKGHWVNGKLNGFGEQVLGEFIFIDDTYTGEFKGGHYEGRGVYYDKSEDSKYVGEFKNGKPNGKGICKWGANSSFPNRYYDGEWKDGKMHGYGTKFWGKDGKWTNDKYTGEWKNDKMDGIGKYEWADETYYEGPWKNGEQNGDGIFVFKNEEVFKGHWDQGYCEALAKKLGLE
ncbi:MAG: hypothetical protein V4511_10260 [Bacteroidota bacterium]